MTPFLILKAQPPGKDVADAVEAPGHTDLMVSPEQIDAFLEANPLPPEVVAAELGAIPDAPEPDLKLGLSDRHDEARRYAMMGRSMRLVDPERPHEAHLVGADLADPHTWRHTLLVDDEPFTDQEFDRAEDAFLAALQAGAVPAAGSEADPAPADPYALDEPFAPEA